MRGVAPRDSCAFSALRLPLFFWRQKLRGFGRQNSGARRRENEIARSIRLRYRGGGWRALLRRDVIIADHAAPELYLARQQRGRGLGRFVGRREFFHAAVGKGLLHPGIGQRGAQRDIELVDDRARRALGRQQNKPEIYFEPLVAAP